MSRIMIIAGGDWQIPIVKTAKEMGHHVLCSNLYSDSPAFRFADDSVVVDVLDKKKNLEIAQKWHPDAVLTDQSDIAVPTVAYLCDKLNLRGIGEKVAQLFTNKFLMRDFEDKMGFRHPRFSLCHSYMDATNALTVHNMQNAIIKPVDSQSSRGVFRINRDIDFQKEYKIAEHNSTSKQVIIEEYIDGVEFTVDGLMLNGTYHTLAISKKKHYPHNQQIASDLFFSWDDDEYNYRELETINARYISTAGLPFGLTHSEYKCCDGHYYLIEMAARGGGTLISSDIAPYMSGINGPKELLRFLLGEKVNICPKAPKSQMALLHFFDIPTGLVKSIAGEAQVRNTAGVHALHLDIKEGDIAHKPDNDRGRVGFAIIFGESHNDIVKTLSDIEKHLKFDIAPYVQ